MEIVSGDGQSARAGTELPEPLVARVVINGSPVQGQIVNFHVVAGGGSVFAGAAISDLGGIVQERWTLGSEVGAEQSVEARAVDNQTGQPLVFGVFTATALANIHPVSVIDVPSQDTTVTLGDALEFQGTASDGDGTIASHAWDFGDGNVASVEDPGTYTYGAEGVYTVTYYVTDSDGADSDASVVVITVEPPPNQQPTSTITNPSQDTTVTLGDAVDFMGSASDVDGTIVGHVWDYGDGNGAGAEDPEPHTYATPGVYAVTYQVTDDDGASSSPSSVSISVIPPPTITNYALRFYGNGEDDIDRVKIRIDDPANSEPGPPVDVGATDFTIEFWMRALASENGAGAVACGANDDWIEGNVIIDRDRFNQDRKFGLSMAGGRIVFGVTGSQRGVSRTICGTSQVDDGEWHHVAVTRERVTGSLQLFVDGVREAIVTAGPLGDISYPDDGVPGNFCGGACVNSDPFLVIGAEKHDAGSRFPSFSGWLDEIRISTVIRYTSNFTPPSSRFPTDGSTVGLYHFDEGAGDIVGDTSGALGGPSNGVRRFGGSPAGPVWVISDAPTGS